METLPWVPFMRGLERKKQMNIQICLPRHGTNMEQDKATHKGNNIDHSMDQVGLERQ